MEERQVTVDAQTYTLPTPFMVIATQNPVELEGTYPLPEAQLDRFLLRLRIGYPDRDAELAILDAQGDERGRTSTSSSRSRDAETVAAWSQGARPRSRRARAAGLHRRPRRRDAPSPRPHARREPARRARVCSAASRRSPRASAAPTSSPTTSRSLAPSVLEHRLVLSSGGDDARRERGRRARVDPRQRCRSRRTRQALTARC